MYVSRMQCLDTYRLILLPDITDEEEDSKGFFNKKYYFPYYLCIIILKLIMYERMPLFTMTLKYITYKCIPFHWLGKIA